MSGDERAVLIRTMEKALSSNIESMDSGQVTSNKVCNGANRAFLLTTYTLNEGQDVSLSKQRMLNTENES